mmetsp:Transcript_35879/g.114960  ORF Transcript_35879/g.114960 Transcript_35879/m.114960 type:complete len:118 (-) Transcript_35879:673-1026(-)
MKGSFFFVVVLFSPLLASAFVPSARQAKGVQPLRADPLGFLKKMKDELDAVVDDAMMKKMGNGTGFYGKRKSNFYGKEDEGKTSGKQDDDYSGPVGGSYFKLDRNGNPVSRRGTPLK